MKRRSLTTRRRAFLLSATVGLLAPVKARSQKRRRIGALTTAPPDRIATFPVWIAFLDGLRTYGWNEDNNLEIIIRATGGDHRRVPALADELLGAGVELVIAVDTYAAQTLVQRTKTVPIVVLYSADPVAAGLVSSLARPGGNITGFSTDQIELSSKSVQFARELVPGLRRLAILFNPEMQLSVRGFHQVETLAPAFGIEMIPAPVATSEQMEPALAALAREQPQVLMVHSASAIRQHSARIAEFAIGHGIVTLGSEEFQARAGCLLSYHPDDRKKFRRLAHYVDRILGGAAPSDLPVELVTYQLIVNAATARALGLAIPPAILAFADEVIE